MSPDEFVEFLGEEVRRHNEWLRILPTFYRDDSELVESLEDHDLVGSSTEGFEVIQKYLEKNSKVYNGDIPISLLDGEWVASYWFVQEGWLFSKSLDYERIVTVSRERDEIIKSRLTNKIRSISPEDFEYLLFEIFTRLEEYGDPTKRPQTRDGGYEMVVTRPHKITGSQEHIYIQAKHQSKKVSVGQTRELIGTLDVTSGENRSKRVSGLMISIKGATPDARSAAKKSSFQIDFLALEDLVNIMYRYKIGWRSRELRFAAIDESFWNGWREEDD